MPVAVVVEDQNVGVTGNLIDVYTITYTIPGREGSFTISVPKNAEALQEATDAINALTEQVNALYGIP